MARETMVIEVGSIAPAVKLGIEKLKEKMNDNNAHSGHTDSNTTDNIDVTYEQTAAGTTIITITVDMPTINDHVLDGIHGTVTAIFKDLAEVRRIR
ncbi:MAG: hypothetical protein K0S75_365 [Clostridia bacterium]|jgi:GTP:adenosylcobinamide-phosphate guanylyltransferase|nr:hypothetical protein [Clostridia bacterium]